MPVSLMADELSRIVKLSWPDGSIRLSNDEWDNETEHWFSDLVGWFGGVGVESDKQQRALTHGVATGETRRTARTLTLSGELFFPQQDLREAASRYVSGILGDGRRGELAVWTEGHSQVTSVQLDGEIKWTSDGSEWISVEIPLIAPDPWIYGPIRSAQIYSEGIGRGLKWGDGLFSAGHLRWGGSVPNPLLTNDGNADSWPTFKVTGDFARGFRLISGSQVFEYPEPVFRGAPVTVSPGRVMVGNQEMSHEVSRRGWISIGPYSAITPRLVSLDTYGEGRADVTWRSTYI